jgi:hypothetical protein
MREVDMRSLGIATLILVLVVGCKKSKPSQADSAPPPPAPAPNVAKGNTGGGAGNVGVIPTPVGGGIVTNPGAIAGSGGGGGGAIQAVRKAARRADALNEMNTLGQVISFMQNDLGRMPTREQIVAELKQYPKLLGAVNDGAFILTGTTQAGGMWAYEADAENAGGIALIGGRAARSSADEVKQYLRGN